MSQISQTTPLDAAAFGDGGLFGAAASGAAALGAARGRGVMEMLGCWLDLALFEPGLGALWMVSPLVLIAPASVFFALSAVDAPAGFAAPEAATWPWNACSDLAIA